MTKEERKKNAAVPPVVEVADTATADTEKQAVKEMREEQKLKFAAKINTLISDKELQEALHKVVADAIDEGFALGCAAGIEPEAMNFMTGSVKDFLGKIANPTDAERAGKYKQLYLNQRMIAIHLQSALQFACSQVAVYETGEEPFTSPLSKTLGNSLGATLSGLGALSTVFQKKESE